MALALVVLVVLVAFMIRFIRKIWRSARLKAGMRTAAEQYIAATFDSLCSIEQPAKETYRAKAVALQMESLASSFVQVFCGALLLSVAWLALIGTDQYVLPDSTGASLGLAAAGFIGIPLLVWITMLILIRFTRIGYVGTDGRVFRALLDALTSGEWSPDWGTPDGTAHLGRQLEAVGTALDTHFRQFRTGDAVTDRWLRGEAEGLVAAARSRKRLVYLPGHGGREELTRGLSHDLACVLSGNWSGLTKIAEPEKLETPLQRVKSRIPPLLLAIAIIVGAWVLNIADTPFQLEGETGGYASITILALVLFLLCKALYPSLISELTALSDLRRLMSKS